MLKRMLLPALGLSWDSCQVGAKAVSTWEVSNACCMAAIAMGSCACVSLIKKSHHGLWLHEAGVHIYILAAELYEKLLAQVH